MIGTARVLRFCCSGGGPMRTLHHVSTLGVYPVRQFNSSEVSEGTAIDSSAAAAIATGYSQSKFVADAVVRLFAQRQPPGAADVCIYRPARIVGDYYTGRGQWRCWGVARPACNPDAGAACVCSPPHAWWRVQRAVVFFGRISQDAFLTRRVSH